MKWLAVDIGGANVKLADGNGYAESIAFPMWKQSEQLGDILKQLLSAAPSHDALAVTMTAELADCFATKSDGVRFVVNRVKEAFSHLALSGLLEAGSLPLAAGSAGCTTFGRGVQLARLGIICSPVCPPLSCHIN